MAKIVNVTSEKEISTLKKNKNIPEFDQCLDHDIMDGCIYYLQGNTQSQNILLKQSWKRKNMKGNAPTNPEKDEVLNNS